MNYTVAVILLLFPTVSWAAEALRSPPDLAIGSMIASLLLVIACIFIFAFLMKKSNLIHTGRGKTLIKIVATQSLTNKGRVQIIEVGDKRYLLGVTEQQISLLDTLVVPEDESVNELASEKPVNPFASLLSKISAIRNE